MLPDDLENVIVVYSADRNKPSILYNDVFCNLLLSSTSCGRHRMYQNISNSFTLQQRIEISAFPFISEKEREI